MFHRFKYCLTLFVFLGLAPLQGEEAHAEPQKEVVINTIDHVVLTQIPHLNTEGHLIGQAYFVRNDNPYPVYIKIRITKSKNVKNELTTMTKTVLPHQRIGLGDVWKDNIANATWDYDWIISRNPL